MEPLTTNKDSFSFKNYIILMRTHQYIKNIFIFLPLFFGLKIQNFDLFLNTFFAFAAFCLAASSIYIFNDFHDIENDKKHPEKKFRPLAAGIVSKFNSVLLMIFLLFSGLTLSYYLNKEVFFLIIIYIAINYAYSIILKKIVVVDVITISSGFIIRLFIGSEIANVVLSKWIVAMTFLLSLFIALAKRRNDLHIYLDSGNKARKVINDYNMKYLNNSMYAMAIVIVISYLFYTITGTNIDNLYVTVVWVILGISRYLWITFIDNNSGSPTKIFLGDKYIISVLFGWIISFAVMIYQ